MNRIRALLALAAYQATPPERPQPGCALAALHYSEDFAAAPSAAVPSSQKRAGSAANAPALTAEVTRHATR